MTLILVTGPPGAGKSTIARGLAGSFGRSVLIEGDAFFAFIARGAITPWTPEAHQQNETVTRAGGAAAGRYVAGGFGCVYDGVVGPWFLPDFLASTGLDSLHYAVILPPEDQCVAQVASRTGHGFTDEGAARHLYRDFATAGAAGRHLFVNPPGQVADTVRDILDRARGGTLRYP